MLTAQRFCAIPEVDRKKISKTIGAQAKALEVARKMKAKGLDEEMISEMSGLSAEVIKKL